MSDRELINMIVDKIDNLKEDINSRLDKHEEKLDAQTEKLNSFEVRAESVLAAHDKDITQLKKEVDELKVEKTKKTSSIYSFAKSDTFTFWFRVFITTLLGLLTAFGAVKSDNAQKAINLFTGGTNTELIKTTDVKK